MSVKHQMHNWTKVKRRCEKNGFIRVIKHSVQCIKRTYFIDILNFLFSTERQFFEMERGCMIVLRLRKLIESKSDKHAFNFCQKALQAIRTSRSDQPLRQNVSVRQHQDLQEAYMSLLVKYKKYVQLKDEIEELEEGALYAFLRCSIETERVEKAADEQANNEALVPMAPKRKKNRLLKYQCQVNQFAIQLYVQRLLSIENFESDHQKKLNYFLGLWLHQYKNDDGFRDKFKTLVDCAYSRFHLYLACEKLWQEVKYFQINP